MNYIKHYNMLVERARNRTLSKNIYNERHHIIPKCLGGSNNKNNLVNLLPEEHIIAHLLLRKIYPNNKSILYAVYCMINGLNKSIKKVYSNKTYGLIRREHSKHISKQNSGQNNPGSKTNMSEEQRKQKAQKTANIIKQRGSLSKENHPLWGFHRSAETKRKISLNHQECKGSFNGNAKIYELISPKGEIFKIHGKLNTFCEEHNISYSIIKRETNKGIILRTSDMRNVSKSEKSINTSGWSCVELTPFLIF